MPNFIISNVCNTACEFCFAKNRSVSLDDFMTLQEFEHYLTFFSSEATLSIAGGEPTLHPQFEEFISLALERKFTVVVLTNGLWSKNVQNFISRIKQEPKVRYLFNIRPRNQYTLTELSVLKESLSIVISSVVTLNMTIDREIYDLSFHFELMTDFKIKFLTYSIAAYHPGKRIMALDDYRKLVPTIMMLDHFAHNAGIELVNNCGYIPRCAFSEKELQILTSREHHQLKFQCQYPSMDVGTNGLAWRCFGFEHLSLTELFNYKSDNDLRRFFDHRTHVIRNIPAFEQCSSCHYFNRLECDGGCLGFRVQKALEIPLINRYLKKSNELDLDGFVLSGNTNVIKKDQKGIYLESYGQRIDYEDQDLVGPAVSKLMQSCTLQELFDCMHGFYARKDECKKDVETFLRHLIEYDAVTLYLPDKET